MKFDEDRCGFLDRSRKKSIGKIFAGASGIDEFDVMPSYH